MSEEKQETASSPTATTSRWNKKSFEDQAGVKVSCRNWEVLSGLLVGDVNVGDQLWSSAVSFAKNMEEQDKEIEKRDKERDKEIEKRDKEIEKRDKEIETLKAEALTSKSKQFLVLSVSEAAKDSQLREKFRKNQVAEEPCRGGFIAQKFYLDFVRASREFEKLDRKDEVVQRVADLGRVLAVHARAPHSLFNNDYLDEEAPQSAVGAELFRLAIDLLRPDRTTEPVPSLKVTHQQHLVNNIEIKDGRYDIIRKKRKREVDTTIVGDNKALDQLDICAWFVHPERTLGACVLAACEYKPSCIKEVERKAHADMYGSNILLLHQKQCIVIDIAGANDLENWVVSAYGLVKAEFSSEPHSWEKSPLYSGRGAEAIVLVAHGLLEAQKSFPGALQQYGRRLGPVVGVIDKFVYKVYDRAEHRNPNIEVVRKLLDGDAELLSSDDGKLKIVKMKLMKSDWKKDVSTQVFKDLIEQLQTLHANFHPHGDIRLANLLSCGKIVDFDFVGAGSYPSTFNLISQDGERHPEVASMIERVKNGDKSPLEPCENHDWFSLGKVMCLFTPTDEENLSSWDGICNTVEKGEDLSSLTIPTYDVRLRDRDIPLRGTGNTPINQQPRFLAE